MSRILCVLGVPAGFNLAQLLLDARPKDASHSAYSPGNPTGAADLHDIAICLVAQCALVFGLAGIFWPEKLSPIFDTLMFPWPSSLRTVRTNSIGALALSALLVLGLLSRNLL